MTTKKYSFSHWNDMSSLEIEFWAGTHCVQIEKVVDSEGLCWYHVFAVSFSGVRATGYASWYYYNKSDGREAWRNFSQLCQLFKEED